MDTEIDLENQAPPAGIICRWERILSYGTWGMQKEPCKICELGKDEQAVITTRLWLSDPLAVICDEYSFDAGGLKHHFEKHWFKNNLWRGAELRRELCFWPHLENPFTLLLPRRGESFNKTIQRRLHSALLRITNPEAAGLTIPEPNPNGMCLLAQQAGKHFLWKERNTEKIFSAYQRALWRAWLAARDLNLQEFSNRTLRKSFLQLHAALFPAREPAALFQTMLKTYGHPATTLAMIYATGMKVVGEETTFEFSDAALDRFARRQFLDWTFFKLWAHFESLAIAAPPSYRELWALLIAAANGDTAGMDRAIRMLVGIKTDDRGKTLHTGGMFSRLARLGRPLDWLEEGESQLEKDFRCGDIPAALGINLPRWQRQFKSDEDFLAALQDDYRAYKNCWRDMRERLIDFLRQSEKETKKAARAGIVLVSTEEAGEELSPICDAFDLQVSVEWQEMVDAVASSRCPDGRLLAQGDLDRCILECLLWTKLKNTKVSNSEIVAEYYRRSRQKFSDERVRGPRNRIELGLFRLGLARRGRPGGKHRTTNQQ